jgi:hypothetical protein
MGNLIKLLEKISCEDEEEFEKFVNLDFELIVRAGLQMCLRLCAGYSLIFA